MGGCRIFFCMVLIMVYGKKKFGKRKRRAYSRKRKSFKRAARPEVKYGMSVLPYSTASTLAGTVTSIAQIAQGVTIQTRVGLADTIVSVSGYIGINSAAVTQEFIRVIMFKWYDKTAPTVGDILLTAATNSVLNPTSRRLYKIIMDRSTSVSATGTDFSAKQWKVAKRCNVKQHYNGTLGNSIVSGDVYFLVMSTNVNVQYGYNLKISFVDV